MSLPSQSDTTSPSTRARPLHRRQKPASERARFLQNNFLTTGSALVAGFVGFAMQAVAGHALHPGEYGKAAAVVSFYTLMTPGTAFGRLVAWQTSHDLSMPDQSVEKSGVLLRSLTTRLFVLGLIVVAVSSLAAPAMGVYMHVPVRYIILGSAAVPFTLATQPLLGSLQGSQRFVPWSFLNVLVSVSRLVFVVALVFGLGAFGVILGTTIGGVVTFAVCLGVMWSTATEYRGSYSYRPMIPFMVIGLASTFAIGVFVSVDVIIVEHFFPRVQSGQYAAVAVIGNAVFFLTGGVANAVFPVIAARHAKGHSTLGIMMASLGLCALGGFIGAFILQILARFVLLHFAGRQYEGGAHIVGWYSVGMAILGCAVVLVNTQQSLNRLTTLWVLVPVMVLRPTLLIFFHHTLMTVVIVSDLSVTGFTLAMLVMYVATERSRLRSVVSEERARLLMAGS